MVYNVTFPAVAVAAVQDLWEILAPSDAVLIILGMEMGQEDLTATELLQIQFRRVTGAPTPGTGGSTPTPRPLEAGAPAAGFTALANNTGQLTGGTNVELTDKYWNVIGDFLYKPIPSERIVISPSTRLLVELPVAPSASSNMSSTLTVEEIGG